MRAARRLDQKAALLEVARSVAARLPSATAVLYFLFIANVINIVDPHEMVVKD